MKPVRTVMCKQVELSKPKKLIKHPIKLKSRTDKERIEISTGVKNKTSWPGSWRTPFGT